MKEKIAVLETKATKQEAEIEVLQTQLAREDTKFAIITHSLKGVEEKLGRTFRSAAREQPNGQDAA